MQNKQTYTVSNLVAKYINTKDDLKVSLLQDAINSGISYCGTEYGTGEELLAHLYKDAAGESMNSDVWNALRQYEQDYNDDALNDDEYDFLKSHFSETVEFMMQHHAYTPIMEVGTLPVSVVDFAIKYLGIKDGEKVYLPNAGYGDAVMLLRNKEVTGFINGRFAWALAQIRFFAAGINADIECLDIYANKEGHYPNLPMAGSVDYIISVYNNARMMPELCHHIDAADYINCLSPNGKAFLFTDGWFLSCNSASNIIKSSISVIQFPELLTETDGEVHGALCGICATSNPVQTSIDLIDLRSAACQGNKLHVFDLDVMKALSIMDEDTDIVKHLEKSKMDDDISLPVYYFANRPRIGHSIDMVMKLIDFKEYSLDYNLPVITLSNLSDDFSHSSIDIDELDTISKVKSPWKHNNFRLVTEPCMLLSVSPTDVKCGYISEIPETGLAVSSGILAIKPENGVSFETTVLLLQSDYVKEQLSALTHSLYGKNAAKYFSKVIVWPEVYNDDLNEELLLEELEEQAHQETIQDELLMEELEEQAHQEAIQDELMLEELEEQARQDALQDELQKEELEEQVRRQDKMASHTMRESIENRPINKELDNSLVESVDSGSQSVDDTDLSEDDNSGTIDDKELSNNDNSTSIDDIYTPESAQAISNEYSIEELVNALQVSEEERKEILKKTREGIKKQKQEVRDKLIQEIKEQRDEIRVQQAYYKKTVRIKKHALSQDVSSLSSMFAKLDNYRKKTNGMFNQDDSISLLQNIKVKEVFEFIASCIADIEEKVDKIADDGFSWEEDSIINPEKFIEEYIKSKSSSWINFTYSKSRGNQFVNVTNYAQEDTFGLSGCTIKKGEPLHGIIMPKDALIHIFDNIIANAKEHAFTDSNRNDYKLNFDWYFNEDSITIEISNNGTPIKKEMDVSMLKLYGYSSQLNTNGHSGIGCYEIDSIMQKYGSYKIEPIKHRDYSVKNILTFKTVRQ